MVACLWYTRVQNFGSLFWLWRRKEHQCPYILIWGFGGCWRLLTGVLHLDLYWDMVTDLWYTHVPNCDPLSTFWRCKEHQCPLSSDFGLWRMLKVPYCVLVFCSWFWYDHWSLVYPCSEFWFSILIVKVQRTSMSFKSWFRALEDAGGSWLGFGILILIWKWPMVFDMPMFQILALYIDFEGAKEIHVL